VPEALTRHLLKQWNQLNPGPDIASEQRAKQVLEAQILTSAQTFYNIACSAMNFSGINN
jgi:hypothetical protein